MKRFLSVLIVSALVLAGFTSLKTSPIVDYLNFPGPIHFANTAFALAWSASPNTNYFKQEYLPSGESVAHFNQMILVEVVYGNLTANDALKAQIAQINKRKKTDAIAQYRLIKNPKNDEYILDFTMSPGRQKVIDVVEWSAYRYKNIMDKKGRKGVLMFGISKRGYSDQILEFLTSLEADRVATVKVLRAYTLPEITAER